MPPRRKRASRPGLAGALCVLALLSGCSSNPVTAPPPTIPAAGPADSPPPGRTPAGQLYPLTGPTRATVFDASTAQLVVLCPGADPHAAARVALFGKAADSLRTIALPGVASALVGDGDGTVYLSTRGGYFVVDLDAGHTRRVDVADAEDTDFTAIARRADGKLVLGSADGAVYTLGAAPPASPAASTAVINRNHILAGVDAIVTQGNTAVVLDRGQTSVTTIGADGNPEHALRAGEGATTLAADPRGVVLVADTRGDKLLVYGVDPLMLRQAYPVRRSPYGVVGSRELAWVSQTETNTVVGYDLSTGIPVEKVRYPTVQQPNSLAFDDASGTLYVVSGSGAGVQAIEHAADRR